MTILGLKWVGGRNREPRYIAVKAAAENLINAKKLKNGNARKAAIAAALQKMNNAVNRYVTAGGAGGAATVLPPAGGVGRAGTVVPPAGGAGGTPPANKNAKINMRPFSRGRIGSIQGRQTFLQPNNSRAPIIVPGSPVLEARNGRTVPVVAYKFAGAYYGKSARGVNNNATILGRRLNMFYKLRAVSDNPPTFRYLDDDKDAYKLVSTNGIATRIEKNDSSPFSGPPIQPIFNRWYQGVESLSLNNRAKQYLNIIYPVEIEKVIVKKTNENQGAFNQRLKRATNITKRAVKFSNMKETDNKRATTRANFWKRVSELQASHIKKTNWNNWFNSVGRTFNTMYGHNNNSGLSNKNREALELFNGWWKTLKPNLTTNNRARMFNKARRLPPKLNTENSSTYSGRPNVLAIVPRTSNNTNNNAYLSKVSYLYNTVKPYTVVTSTMNISTNKARRDFWTAVNTLLTAAQRAAPVAAPGAGGQ